MRVLLDTNIVIHRETNNVVNSDIGILFRWIDNLHYSKFIHPITIKEINKYKDERQLKTFNIKLENYNILKSEAPLHPNVKAISEKYDNCENDYNDTKLINELIAERIDILITEDKKIHSKAKLLGINEKVFTIESFLENITINNPELVDYKVLSIKKEYIGNVNINDEFFVSFKEDYPGFEKWFNGKSNEMAYICKDEENIAAFLYLKKEDENENYSDIYPTFTKKKRLKIGTFKVTLNGLKIGERFIKIIFDNAIKLNVEEIYVTIFDKRLEQQRLINLLKDFGFAEYGYKEGKAGKELVFTRDFRKQFNVDQPKLTCPYISRATNIFITPIYPEYHTELFPDSILKTESPNDFSENASHRNAISKVFVSHSYERNLKSGDIIIFYRTGGLYKSVISTIGIVNDVIKYFKDGNEFVKLCKDRCVFKDKELLDLWNKYRALKPFIVNFLYVYSLPKRITFKRLIELGVFADEKSAPRGFTKISTDKFDSIVKEAEIDESIIVD